MNTKKAPVFLNIPVSLFTWVIRTFFCCVLPFLRTCVLQAQQFHMGLGFIFLWALLHFSALGISFLSLCVFNYILLLVPR